MRIVIIGNGVAGVEAALTVRAREPDWPITIVSEESDHFFSRTALMWVASGQLSYRSMEPHERDLYARMRFDRERGRVTGIDTGTRTLKFADPWEGTAATTEHATKDRTLQYDRLLIACGSAPKRLAWGGFDLRGVGHFVSLQDLAWLEEEVWGRASADAPITAVAKTGLASVYGGRLSAFSVRKKTPVRPAVIGGGLIALEVVEVLAARGLAPTFYEWGDGFGEMGLDEREAGWIIQRLRDRGITVRSGADIVALEGDAQGIVRAVRTKTEAFEHDLVVVAAGVVPNTGWLGASPIELGETGGIVVGDGLETNVRGIYAAGDCAAVRWYDGSERPDPCWYAARDQGRVVARRILGEPATYRRGTNAYNSAKLVDIEYTTVGVLSSEEGREESWVFEETGAVHSITRIAVDEGRVIGMNLLGRRWDHTMLLDWIEARRPLDWVIARLAEASFDGELVPRFKADRSAFVKITAAKAA